MTRKSPIKTIGRQEGIMPHGASPQIHPPSHIGNGLFHTSDQSQKKNIRKNLQIQVKSLIPGPKSQSRMCSMTLKKSSFNDKRAPQSEKKGQVTVPNNFKMLPPYNENLQYFQFLTYKCTNLNISYIMTLFLSALIHSGLNINY